MDAIFSINLHELIVNPRLFFYLGIYVGIAIVFYEGYRRKYPFMDWVFVITFSLVCALIGSKLFTYNSEEWQSLIRFTMPDNENVSLIGWRIGVLLGAIFSVRLIGIPKGSFDTIAYAFPVGLIITRIGCLIGGCCYGTPVNSYFAVNYSGSPENLHAVQFYEMLFGAFIIVLNYIIQRKSLLKKPGNLGLFTMMSYFFFRFFIEFIRAGGVYAGGLKIIQWISLIAVVLFALFIIVFEKRYSSSGVYKREKKHYSETVLIFSGTILSAFAFNILSYFESVLLASLIVMFFINYLQKIIFITADYKIFRNQVAMIILSVFFMSFTISNNSIVHNHAENSDVEIVATEGNAYNLDYTKYTNDFSLGIGKGKYPTICGPAYDYTNIVLDYEGIYSFDGKNHFYFQTGGFISDNSSISKQFTQLGTRHVIGYKNNFMKFGLGSQFVNSGVQYGNFVFFGTEYSFAPIIELRIGRRYYFDGYWGSYNHPYIGSSIRAGLGYNFNERINMSIGVDLPSGFYLQGKLFLGESFYLSPYFCYGDKTSYYFGGKLGVRFPNGK